MCPKPSEDAAPPYDDQSAAEMRARALRFRQHASFFRDDVAAALRVTADELEARAAILEAGDTPGSADP